MSTKAKLTLKSFSESSYCGVWTGTIVGLPKATECGSASMIENVKISTSTNAAILKIAPIDN